MPMILRQATDADIPAMHRVRLAVRENRLSSPTRITEADYRDAIAGTGIGFVVQIEGEIVAFAIGDAADGNIWALFVDPAHERQGHGRRLHDVLIDALWSRGVERLWLTTAPGTRAEGFYTAAGWRNRGLTAGGETRFELDRD